MSLNIKGRKTCYHGDGYHGDGYHGDSYHGDGCPAPQLTNYDPLKDGLLHTRFEND